MYNRPVEVYFLSVHNITLIIKLEFSRPPEFNSSVPRSLYYLPIKRYTSVVDLIYFRRLVESPLDLASFRLAGQRGTPTGEPCPNRGGRWCPLGMALCLLYSHTLISSYM